MACQMEVELQQPKAKPELGKDCKRDFKTRETWDELLGSIVHEFVYYYAEPKRCVNELQLLNNSKNKAKADVAARTKKLRDMKLYEQGLPAIIDDVSAKCATLEHELKQTEAELKVCDAEYQRETQSYAKLKHIVELTEVRLLRKKLQFYSADKARCEILVKHGLNAQLPQELLNRIDSTRQSVGQLEVYLKNLQENITQKQREVAQVEARTLRLRNEVNERQEQLNQVLHDKLYHEDSLRRMPKLMQSAQEDLRASIESECALSKAILKMTFINSLIAAEEKEKLMLEAVDLEVGLLKKFFPQ